MPVSPHTPSTQISLLSLLKEHFGFTAFRPLQEAIIRDVLAGRDVLALLPTGGGKSLCFQLPALARPGVTIVVSPLIALMKDQVDGLRANGIAATFLNSSLTVEESQARLRGLRAGHYRLLYMAPERLMLPGYLSLLKNFQVNLLAIDEAHCISEWGHDFRPEYRRLMELREQVPSLPIIALTATATERVQTDIVTLLRLRDPACYVASFNRPNLTYQVQAKENPFGQVLAFLRTHPKDSGILYCQSRKTTEMLANRLQTRGIKAVPYHAGLTGEERTRHQERFLRDEIQVICATIAFGMGINKPNVRFVIHYDVPKNLESYYQETGRAGRDGLTSECLLLFSPGDTAKQQRFIEEKPHPHDQQIARRQLQDMVQYAECTTCRRRALLRYFGEEMDAESCEGCDNCLTPRETFDGQETARTLLTTVEDIRGTSGFFVGLNHLIGVLIGANTEKIRRWGHDELTIYGTGKAYSRPAWASIARELLHLGYLRQTEAPFAVIEITDQGREFLREPQPLRLTQPMSASAQTFSNAQDLAYDESLFNRLRHLRKALADERDVPAYVIFSDVALRQMARDFPKDAQEFLRISGVGNRKLEEFGPIFLKTIAEHLMHYPPLIIPPKVPPSPPPVSSQQRRLGETVHETLELYRLGHTVEEIARQRGLVSSTIYGHLAQAIQVGEPVDVDRLWTAEQQSEMAAAFQKTGFGNLTGAKELLGDDYEFGRLRLFRAIMCKD